MRTWTKTALTIACALALGIVPVRAKAATLELRVLLISVGDRAADPSRAMMEDMMNAIGVPYEVLDSSRENLTQARLESGGRGRFNGIVLTQSETYLPAGGTGFDLAEFTMLHTYERTYGVAESVLSGFPSTNPSLDLDYGMGTIGWGSDLRGRWLAPAGGKDLFEYVRADLALPTEGFAFTASGRNNGVGPTVESVLVNEAATTQGLVHKLTYPDGRRVLLSTLNNAWFFLHSQVLAYEFLNFATSGVFLGGRYVYLALHTDDLFLPNEIWNANTNSNWPEDQKSYRMNGAAVSNAIKQQTAFRQRHPLASTLMTEFAFNGSGAEYTLSLLGLVVSTDSLTSSIVSNKNSFRFINHTFEHLKMDRQCPEDGPQTGLCPVTSYDVAYHEINQNRVVWQQLGLPQYSLNRSVLVTGEHSGLCDRMGTEDTVADDVNFPEGVNPNFAQAALDLGIDMVASDTSYPNQGTITEIDGWDDIVIMPRYPTAIFYNATNPSEDTAEYNWIHYYRYLAAGQDPSTIPGAISAPRTYSEILAAEATINVRHMLSYLPYPHFFHQTNLRPYDSSGHTLQWDWADSVMTKYEQLVKLPVKNLLWNQLADLAWQLVWTKQSAPVATLDTVSSRVTLSTTYPATVRITGIANGTVYGGQRIADVSSGPTPVTFVVDRGYTF